MADISNKNIATTTERERESECVRERERGGGGESVCDVLNSVPVTYLSPFQLQSNISCNNQTIIIL